MLLAAVLLGLSQVSEPHTSSELSPGSLSIDVDLDQHAGLGRPFESLAVNDVGICSRLRASLSPSGDAAFFDFPLMRTRYAPWLGEPHRFSILQGDAAPGPVLVDLNCVIQSAEYPESHCATVIMAPPSSPFSRPSWTPDGSHLAWVTSSGNQVSSGDQSILLLQVLSAFPETNVAVQQRTIPNGQRVMLPGALQGTADLGNVTLDESASQPFLLLDGELAPVPEVTIRPDRIVVRAPSETIEIQSFPLRVTSVTRASADGDMLHVFTDSTELPALHSINIRDGMVNVNPQEPTALLRRPIYSSDGSDVVGMYSDRDIIGASSASEDLRDLFVGLNAFLEANPYYDLYDVSVNEEQNAVLGSFQGQFGGRQFRLFRSDIASSVVIGEPCEGHWGHDTHFSSEAFFVESEFGRIPVRRYTFNEQSGTSVEASTTISATRRALIWFHSNPLDGSGFGLPQIEGLARIAGYDIFSVDYIGTSGRGAQFEAEPMSGSAWRWAVAQCDAVSRYVREQFGDSYDIIGVYGRQIGAIFAMAPLYNTCDVDFSIIHDLVLTTTQSTNWPEGYSRPIGLGTSFWEQHLNKIQEALNASMIDPRFPAYFTTNTDAAWIDVRPTIEFLSDLPSYSSNITLSFSGVREELLAPYPTLANSRQEGSVREFLMSRH